jgi:hypothetical protein
MSINPGDDPSTLTRENAESSGQVVGPLSGNTHFCRQSIGFLLSGRACPVTDRITRFISGAINFGFEDFAFVLLSSKVPLVSY